MEAAEENLYFHTVTARANVSHISSAEFKSLTALFQRYLKHNLNESLSQIIFKYKAGWSEENFSKMNLGNVW